MEQSQQLDQNLWDGIRDGNQTSLGELYELYYRPLYRYGSRLLSDTDLVEDTIQDLFVTLWNTRQKLSDVKNVKAYLFTILRREIYRKVQKEELISDIYEFPELASLDEGNEYEHEDYEKWLVTRLTDMLKNLPERQLDVILLRYYENLQTAEIASIMGITEKSVRNTIYKALTYLRLNIQPLDFIFVILQIFQ